MGDEGGSSFSLTARPTWKLALPRGGWFLLRARPRRSSALPMAIGDYSLVRNVCRGGGRVEFHLDRGANVEVGPPGSELGLGGSRGRSPLYSLFIGSGGRVAKVSSGRGPVLGQLKVKLWRIWRFDGPWGGKTCAAEGYTAWGWAMKPLRNACRSRQISRLNSRRQVPQ